MTPEQKLYLAFCLGFAVIVGIITYIFLSRPCRVNFVNPDTTTLTSSSPSVSYYYNPSCPHCRDFMPEWTKFKTQTKFSTNEIDCTATPDKCANVFGVPYVVFTIGDRNFEYTGQRTATSLLDYQANIQKKEAMENEMKMNFNMM